MWIEQSRLKLVFFALGIIITYSLMNIAVEKLFKRDYDGEKFSYPIAYNWIQCITPTIVAKSVMIVTKHPANETPQKFYIIVSIFHFIGGITSKMALQYISYPVHVIGKACQPIPVVICGLLIARKTYRIPKYIFVLMIVTGIAMFMYKDGGSRKQTDLEYWGNILIGISLLMDGLKGAAQDIMRDVKRPSSMNFMFFENGWSTLILTFILIANGEGLAFVQFCMRHQVTFQYVGIVMLCSTIGQFFISSMITNFGTLPTILTTTMRKFFSVLFSVIIFNHHLIIRQWIATSLIFTALILDVVFSKKHESEENLESDIETENLKDTKNVIEMNNKVSPA